MFNIFINYYIILFLYTYIQGYRRKYMDIDDKKTYFIMTNEKGDYGCMTFTDYEMYINSLNTYRSLGWID